MSSTYSTPRTIRVAAVQAAPAVLDLPRTLERLEEWTRKATGQGAKIVVFPETWVTGYPAWIDSSPDAALWGHKGAKAVFARLVENSVVVPSAETESIGKLARELGITLVVGVHERAGRTLYNAILTFGPDGSLLNHHRKLVPTYGERMVWGYGDGQGLRVVDTGTPVGSGATEAAAARPGTVKLGGLVCWEHWMPLARQALHDQGEEVHAALWPGVQEMHQVASRHYAFEGRCFVVAVGMIMRARDMPGELPLAPSLPATKDPDALLIRGGSAIIAPNGRYLAGPVYNEETVLVADCDLAEIAAESMTLDVSGHYSRPDVFELKVRRERREVRRET